MYVYNDKMTTSQFLLIIFSLLSIAETFNWDFAATAQKVLFKDDMHNKKLFTIHLSNYHEKPRRVFRKPVSNFFAVIQRSKATKMKANEF